MKGYHYFLCGEVSQINKHAGTVFVLFILYKSLRTEGGCPKSFVKILSATSLKNSPQTIHRFFPSPTFISCVLSLTHCLSAFAVEESLETG